MGSVDVGDVLIKGNMTCSSCSLCVGKGDGKDGVGAEVLLERSAVLLEHDVIDAALILRVLTDKSRSENLVNVLNGLQDTLSAETALVAVTELESLTDTG